MPRVSQLYVAALCLVGVGCSVDAAGDTVDTTAALQAAGASGETIAASGRECGPGARHASCPSGQTCVYRSPPERKHGKRIGHCQSPQPACGNGVVETGEECDDANTAAGDGCSDTCHFDDNTSTPGDDRTGYQACQDLTCGPGTRCCYGLNGAADFCITSEPNCGAPINQGNECDGPEDCPAGQNCYEGKGGRACVVTPGNAQYGRTCHVDNDCVGALCVAIGVPCPFCNTPESGDVGSCGAAQ
jgi:cysteine-rich repeat protein